MRGEWIEMAAAAASAAMRRSLPMRGEWIEITSITLTATVVGLSPCGESGLKWVTAWARYRLEAVSPHAGRVD